MFGPNFQMNIKEVIFVPFCLIVQTRSKTSSRVYSQNPTAQSHKISSFIFICKFTTGNPTQTTFFFFVKNPVYVNLLVSIVNHYLLFPSGTKVFGKILIQKRRLNFMTLCYGILTIGTSSSFSRSSCFTGQNEVFSTTE